MCSHSLQEPGNKNFELELTGDGSSIVKIKGDDLPSLLEKTENLAKALLGWVETVKAEVRGEHKEGLN